MVDPMPMIPTEDPMTSTEAPAASPMSSTPDTMTTTGAGDAPADLTQMLDDRMNELPDNQKKFILDYMTPELVGVLGLILGNEAVDYYAPFADPGKMLQVIPRPQEQQAVGPQTGPMSQQDPQQITQAPAPSMAPGA